jgi:hypothetical protein
MAGKRFFFMRGAKKRKFSHSKFLFFYNLIIFLSSIFPPPNSLYSVGSELYRMQDDIWHEFVPPLGEISEDCKWAWKVVAVFLHSSPLVHRFAPTYTLKIACPRQKRQRRNKKVFYINFSSAMFFEKKNLKLFKCYLHEIHTELFKKQAEKWASKKFILFLSMHFCPPRSSETKRKILLQNFKIVCHRKKHSQNV